MVQNKTPSNFSEPALGPLLNELSRLLRREFDRRLAARGVLLTRAQWLILYHLARAQGSTQSELAEALELERMTIGRHATRLEADGWLERRADSLDARVYRLHLKPKAERTLARLEPVVEQLRRDYFAGVEPQRRDALWQDLLKIRQNLLSFAEIPRETTLV